MPPFVDGTPAALNVEHVPSGAPTAAQLAVVPDINLDLHKDASGLYPTSVPITDGSYNIVFADAKGIVSVKTIYREIDWTKTSAESTVKSFVRFEVSDEKQHLVYDLPVNVVDTTPPVISGLTNLFILDASARPLDASNVVQPKRLLDFSSVLLAGVGAVDAIIGDVSDTIALVTPNELFNQGNYTTLGAPYSVSITASDGTNTVVEQRKVIVSNSNIVYLPANPHVIEASMGAVYVDACYNSSDKWFTNLASGVLLNDATDVIVSVNSSAVVMNVSGSYDVLINVKDKASDLSFNATRTVTVQDTLLPVITILNNDISNDVLKLNFTDVSNSTLALQTPLAEAFDQADGDCSVNVLSYLDGSSTLLVPADVSLNVFGKTYKIVYNSSDNAGNSESSELKIMLTDTQAPSIAAANKTDLEARLTPAFNEATDVLPIVVNDNYDLSASVTVTTISGSVDVTTPGAYTLVYQAEDSYGNKATTSRTVTVVDTTAPVITLVNPNLTYAKYINEFNYLEQGGSAVDIVAGDVSLVITVFEMSGGSQEVALTADASNSAYYPGLWRVQPDLSNGVIVNTGKGKPGQYKVKYNATDGSTAAAEIVRNIYILRDVENPTIEVSGVVTNVQIGSDPSGVPIMGDVSGVTIEAGTITSNVSFVAGAATQSGYYGANYLIINDSNWEDICLNITTDLSVNDASFGLVGDFTETITITDPDNNSANVVRRIKIVDTVGPSFALSGTGLDINNRLVLQSSAEAGNNFSDISAIVQATNTSDVAGWETIPDTLVTSSLVGEQDIHVYAVDVNDLSSATQMRYVLFV